MSIFGSIMSKIFGSHGATATVPDGNAVAATPGATQPTTTPGAKVDVYAILSEMAAKKGQKLNWKVSIVDLMTLLDMDSSMTARKALAAELHFTGDTNDSAAMNIWLHKQVMMKLAENGGVLPADLRD